MWKKNNCVTKISELGEYKTLSAERAIHPQFKTYNFTIWKEAIDVFAMRLSCLLGQVDTVSYEQYVETMNPHEIHKFEKRESRKGRVFILSAFPEFLLDYFGIKLWKTCVKHTTNKKDKQGCNNG